MQATTKPNFIMDDDAVHRNLVPKTTLYTGAELPSVGLGNFGSDAISGETVAAAVKSAAKVGYRHFDCASVYGNEEFHWPILPRVDGGGAAPRGNVDHLQTVETTNTPKPT